MRTLWDRKTDGGFPETKELKRRVRDVIEPGRDLGHVDRDYRKSGEKTEGDAVQGTKTSEARGGEKEISKEKAVEGEKTTGGEKCEDCS